MHASKNIVIFIAKSINFQNFCRKLFFHKVEKSDLIDLPTSYLLESKIWRHLCMFPYDIIALAM